MEIDPLKAIEYIQRNAGTYAQAKANRIYIENYLKTVKARLMGDSEEKAIGAKEMDAYANPVYVEQLDGLKAAIEVEENLRYMLEAAKLKVEIFKVQEYTKRTEMKMQ
jgi:hypothetical protein